MDLLKKYYDSDNRRLVLPAIGLNDVDIDPIRMDDLLITSADFKQQALVSQLRIHADGVAIERVLLPESVTRQCEPQGSIRLRGDGCSVKMCQLMNNAIGIQAEKKAHIRNNLIMGFSQDAIQFVGDGTHIEGNVIGKLVLKDGGDQAHHDGIQGWSGDPASPWRAKGRYEARYTLRDVVIQNNTIFDDPRSPLQGITFFDGLADDWIVSGNLIMLYGNHPITILGLGENRRGHIGGNALVQGQIMLLPARRWLAAAKQWETVLG